jgi:inner membrane transporter RhtA
MTEVGNALAGVALQPTGTHRPRLAAPLLVLGAAISVQSGSAIAKALFPIVGPPGVVFLRVVFGTLILALTTRPRLHGWTRQQLLLVAGLGTALAGLNLTFYEAIARVPLGVAVTVEFIGPLAVAIVGLRHGLDLVWVALAAAGIALLAAGGSHAGGAPLGLVLAAVSGGFWAAYIVLGARVGRMFPDNSALLPAMAVAALWLLPVGVRGVGSHLFEWHVLVRAMAVGALSSAIPWTLELTALRRVPARVFGVIVSLTPAVAALSGFLFLGERLGPSAWVALGLVVSASAGATMRQQPTPAANT